jgi:hypothetical protein
LEQSHPCVVWIKSKPSISLVITPYSKSNDNIVQANNTNHPQKPLQFL